MAQKSLLVHVMYDEGQATQDQMEAYIQQVLTPDSQHEVEHDGQVVNFTIDALIFGGGESLTIPGAKEPKLPKKRADKKPAKKAAPKKSSKR